MSEKFQNLASDRLAPSLPLNIGIITLCRLLLNTARRFAYPFAPVLSRGMGVSLTAVTTIIAVNQATTLLGMLFGPLTDRLGCRLMMLLGLSLLTLGLFLGGILPFYGVIMTALFLAGLGKSIFDPAYQAYIGENVPYHRRGLVVGVVEMSWAGSTLIGVPLIAILIDRLDWRAPFFTLSGIGLLGILAIGVLIPGDKKTTSIRQSDFDIRESWGKLFRERTALGALGFAFFVSVANDNLFVVYGAWLERTFNLSIVAIGLGTSVIGVAELCGELLTAFFADRFGLKRSVLAGLVLTMLAYGVLPFSEPNLALSMGGLFFVFLTFEFTIVSFLSLGTELQPKSRATMMAGFFAAAGIGRILGALMGGAVWMAGGILATGIVSTVFSAFSLVSLAWGLKHWQKVSLPLSDK